VQVKPIQHTQKEACAYAVSHQVLGDFEIKRTSDLVGNEQMFVRGMYVPAGVHGMALININVEIIDVEFVKETIAHELLHHLFATKVTDRSEEGITSAIAPMLIHIVECANELADYLFLGHEPPVEDAVRADEIALD